MTDIDPTGTKAIVAAIEPGQLSERQQRIATGMALVRDQGMPVKTAARKVHIPRTTLRRYLDGMAELATGEDHEVAITEIRNHSLDISRMAAERIAESLSEKGDEWKPGDLVKAYGVSTDKAVAMTQHKPPEDDGVSALSRLLEAGDTVTITKADRAIDVTPERESDE